MHFTDYFIIFASGLAIIMAAGLVLRPLRYRNAVFAVLLLLAGYINFFMYLFHTQSIVNYPHIFFLQSPVGLSIGPLVYFYVKSLAEDKKSMQKKDWLHFVPALAMLISMAPYITLSGNEKIEILNLLIKEDKYRFILYTGVISVSFMVAYTILSIKIIGSRFKSGNPVHDVIKFFFLILILLLAIGILSVFSLITLNMKLMRINNILISILYISLYLMSQRYPYLLQHGTVPGMGDGHSKSRLRSINIKNLDKNMRLLMEEDKFYCDEDITLARMSDALEITPHQLSEFLNEHYKKNFNNFINGYRVGEAKKLLVDEPNRNTLSIAYASGFNSYSTFHSSFRKETGMSPAEYRRKKLR